MTPGERLHIQRALSALGQAGFRPAFVLDGETVYGEQPCMTENEVLAAIDAVDESYVYFERADPDAQRLWMRVILGNADDGSEVIADYSIRNEAFAAVLDNITNGGAL